MRLWESHVSEEELTNDRRSLRLEVWLIIVCIALSVISRLV